MILRLLIPFILLITLSAKAENCSIFNSEGCSASPDGTDDYLPTFGSSRPSSGSFFDINPSMIDLNKLIGFELTYFRDETEFALTSGNGFMGAGISLNASDGTFFGNVPRETDAEYRARHLSLEKYNSPKKQFAFAFKVFEEGGEYLPFQVTMAIIGNYNKETKKTRAGGGITFSLGPLYVGAAKVKETYLDKATSTIDEYDVDTFSTGLKIWLLSFDYSYLRTNTSPSQSALVYSGSLLLNNVQLIHGYRNERSTYPYFDKDDKTFTDKQKKKSQFYGIKYFISDNFALGGYYNYYLLNEYTAGLSISF